MSEQKNFKKSLEFCKIAHFPTLTPLKLLRVTSEYHSFHYMILRDHIHSIVSSEI